MGRQQHIQPYVVNWQPCASYLSVEAGQLSIVKLCADILHGRCHGSGPAACCMTQALRWRRRRQRAGLVSLRGAKGSELLQCERLQGGVDLLAAVLAARDGCGSVRLRHLNKPTRSQT